MSNAMANMYDNNAEFREMVDDLHAGGYPVNIYIQDDTLSENAQNKEHPHSMAPAVEKYDAEGNPILTGVDIVISSQDFTHSRFGVDNNEDGLTDQENHQGLPDATAYFTFERLLTHELYHARDWTEGKIPLRNEMTYPEDHQKPYELRATEFENRVIADSSALNDPNNVHRNYYGDRYVNVYDTRSGEPNFIDKSPPQLSTERPWTWKKEAHPDAVAAVQETTQALRTMYSTAENQPAGVAILLPTFEDPDPRAQDLDHLIEEQKKHGKSPAEYTDTDILEFMIATHEFQHDKYLATGQHEEKLDYPEGFDIGPDLYAQSVIDSGIVKDENGQPVHFDSPKELLEAVRGQLQERYNQKYAPQENEHENDSQFLQTSPTQQPDNAQSQFISTQSTQVPLPAEPAEPTLPTPSPT